MARFFRHLYGPALLAPLSQVFALGLYILYLAVAIYGCSQVLSRIVSRLSR